jgi:hypothetical protein
MSSCFFLFYNRKIFPSIRFPPSTTTSSRCSFIFSTWLRPDHLGSAGVHEKKNIVFFDLNTTPETYCQGFSMRWIRARATPPGTTATG